MTKINWVFPQLFQKPNLKWATFLSIYKPPMTIICTTLSSELRETLESITQLAQKHHVARLEAFGSAVTGKLGKDSDIDLLVTFKPLPVQKHGQHYFGLKHSLEDLLGRPVDLLELKAINNPYFLTSTKPERVLLHTA